MKASKRTPVKAAPREGKVVVPARAEPAAANFPIVGIGASAGGLAAFKAFFSGLPVNADPRMAFVLLQHMDPNSESRLTELVRGYTRMKVFKITDGLVLQPNCVYIVPPGFDLKFLGGALHLLAHESPRRLSLPIDQFFNSLAQDQGERGIGIVLSGTGTDGTLGVRTIKAAGGLVMVQTPATAEFNGMPRSAIATGCVDYELPPAEMPAKLIAYAAQAFGKPDESSTAAPSRRENARQLIFALLRAQTGNDFSLYKTSTIDRRIQRRMAVHQIDAVERYAKFLQQTPEEVEALFREILIGVTDFFRDPESFSVLETQCIAKLVAEKTKDGTIRIWVPACATGEEAYSIAMLVAERMEALKVRIPVQIFATDVSRHSITTARAGHFSAEIATHVPPERLKHFFMAEPTGDGYRVKKSLRDLLIFSEQNALQDPPFAKLDLISCRNLLIYLRAELQQQLMGTFHFALRPGGMLFLGNSETVGNFHDQFLLLDRKAQLYQRRELLPGLKVGEMRLPTLPIQPVRVHAANLSVPAKRTPRELTEQILLGQVSLVAVLVDSRGNILYLHGRAGKFLELAAGEIRPNNILKMARAGLRQGLGIALRQVARTNEVGRWPGLRVEADGQFVTVNLSIHPVALDWDIDPESRPYLVILDEVPTVSPIPQPDTLLHTRRASHDRTDIAALQKALFAREESMQSAHEELASSAEELRCSNQEMQAANDRLQSVNEELKSTNEELETSKEEMQSLNEELNTMNAELGVKVSDLSRSNNDMNNLIAGTGIATVFLDLHLRILRFTPPAKAIVNLLASDVGRPIGHFVSNLVGYLHLVEDAQGVLDTLVPKEIEVQSNSGAWYLMRLHPYRTVDNVIEGVVISFIVITEIVLARLALQQANRVSRMAVVVRDSHDAVTVQELGGGIQAWNPSAVRMYGWSEAEALALNARERIPAPLRSSEMIKFEELGRTRLSEPYRTQRLTKAGKIVEIWMTATCLVNESGELYAVATTERAIRPVPDETAMTTS